MDRVKKVNDILDWLSYVFGFQVTNAILVEFSFLVPPYLDVELVSYVEQN